MSRLETVKTKYPDIEWDKIKLIDPSKNFKYLDWIGANFKSSSADEIKMLLGRFEKIKTKLVEKDIAKYDVTALKKSLEEAGASKQEAKMVGIVELPDIDGIKITMIEGKEAAKSYFAGTKWCISNWDTFINYCNDNNIYVLTKNKIKICMVSPIASIRSYDTNNNLFQFFMPNDKALRLLDDSFNYLFKFTGFDDSAFSKIATACWAHSKTYKNVWYALNYKINQDSLNRANELLDSGDIVSILSNKNSTDKLIKAMGIVVKNKENYTDLIKEFTTSKSQVYDYYRYKYVTVSELWQEYGITPEEKKAIEKKKWLEELAKEKKIRQDAVKAIEGIGGLEKYLLNNKELAVELAAIKIESKSKTKTKAKIKVKTKKKAN